MKYHITIASADGTSDLGERSRKDDAVKAAERFLAQYGAGFTATVTSPKGAVVWSDGTSKPDAPAVPVLPKGKKAKAAKAAGAPAKAKAPKKATKAKKARTVKIGTFVVTDAALEAGQPVHVCVGACGETKSVKSYPTLSGRPGVRAAECRSCRDTRTKKA